MKEINYWEQFMATGKIDDFLAYKNAGDKAQNKEESGEHSHAGDHRDYGNDYKS